MAAWALAVALGAGNGVAGPTAPAVGAGNGVAGPTAPAVGAFPHPGPWRRRAATILYALGELSVLSALAWLWISLERPPLRTMGETRLWYAALLPLCGFAVQWRWGIRWLSGFCAILAGVFLAVNLAHPEAHDQVLMPALRSFWFVPHVVVYLVGYALLGAAALAGVRGLLLEVRRRPDAGAETIASRLAVLGFIFLTFGLVFGAVWAKEAWGHYWTWDPKETWALLTWLVYLVFIHLVWESRLKRRGIFAYLALAFLVLLFCWFGFSYLASSRSSVHSYSG
jgi:ABC-type transport system involved in cytochrome c biogenesis permease subunit